MRKSSKSNRTSGTIATATGEVKAWGNAAATAANQVQQADRKTQSWTESINKIANGMKSWGNEVASLGLSLTALGVAISTPFALAAKTFTETGAAINDFAERTGVAVESVAALSFAAESTGASMEALEIGFKDLAKLSSKALMFEPGAMETLRNAGIAVSSLRGQSPEKIFEMMADKIAGINDPIRRAAVSLSIFGRSGTELLPLMQKGSAGIAEMRREAERLGLVMSAADVEAAAALDASLHTLWQSVEGVSVAIGSTLAESLKDQAEVLTGIAKPIGDFIRNNKELIVGIAATGTAVLAAGGALTVLGAAMSMLGSTITGIASLAGLIGAAIFNPITVLAVAAATAAGVIAYSTGGLAALGTLAKQVGSSASGAFGTVKQMALSVFNEVKETVGGITNALKAGKIETAWEMAGVALEIGWLETLDAMQDALGSWVGDIADALQNGKFNNLMKIVGLELEIGWVKTCNFMGEQWANFCNSLGDTLIDALGKVIHTYVDFKIGIQNLAGDNITADEARLLHRGADFGIGMLKAGNVNTFQPDTEKLGVLNDQLKDLKSETFAGNESPDKLPDLRERWQALAESVAPGSQASRLHPGFLNNNFVMKDSTTGTFSARGALGIGANDPATETAKNTKDIATGIKKLVNKPVQQVVFGA